LSVGPDSGRKKQTDSDERVHLDFDFSFLFSINRRKKRKIEQGYSPRLGEKQQFGNLNFHLMEAHLWKPVIGMAGETHK